MFLSSLVTSLQRRPNKNGFLLSTSDLVLSVSTKATIILEYNGKIRALLTNYNIILNYLEGVLFPVKRFENVICAKPLGMSLKETSNLKVKKCRVSFMPLASQGNNISFYLL